MPVSHVNPAPGPLRTVRRQWFYFLSVPLLSALLVLPAEGQEAAQPVKKWKDTAELSFVKTSGNSSASSVSGKNMFSYDWDRAALEASAGGLRSRDGRITTAEQYNASEKVSLKLSGKNYALQKTVWDRNRFAGIRSRYDHSLGLGRSLLDRPDDKLLLEAGGGYIFEDRINSRNKSFGSYRAYLKYVRTLSPTASASQELEYLGDMSDPSGYRTNTETSVVTSISTHFSLKASYVWHYVNSPVEGFRKADTITSMAVVVNY